MNANQAVTLRPYQLEQVEAVQRFHDMHQVRSVLLDAATGTGKSVSATELARRWVARGETVLFLAHRRELIDQMAAHMARAGLKVGIERGSRHAGAEPVVCASVQTMRGERLEAFPRDAFDKIIVDECHHTPAAGYRAILDHFHSAQVVGVTATTDRADGIPLATVFSHVAHRYGIAEAIAAGYLTPIRGVQVTVRGMDLSKVRSRKQSKRGGEDLPADTRDLLAPSGQARVVLGAGGKVERVSVDLHPKDLGRAVIAPEAVEGVVVPLLELAGERPTIVFAVDRNHAEAIADAINVRRPGAARWLWHKTSDRKQVQEDHKAGKFQFLVNVQLLCEGYDDSGIACVAMARPTQSRVLYSQCLDEATEILTPDGWKRIDDEITEAAAFDSDTGLIHWSPAQKMSRFLGNEEMYGIDNPHLSLRVTAGHRMLYKTRTNPLWTFVRADSLPGTFYVPVCGSSGLPDTSISDDDIRFLGLLLTDGCRNQLNNAIVFTQSEKHPDVIEYIWGVIRGCGFKCGHFVRTNPTNFGPRSPLHSWTVSKGKPRGRDSHLAGWGRLDPWVSGNGKVLTDIYETLSQRQVFVLLDALYQGNGSKRDGLAWNAQSVTLTIANRKLGEQLQSLFVRRGLRCNLTPLPSVAVTLHVGDSNTWHVSQRSSDSRPVWSRVPTSPEERVWCVEVDTGAIVVRRHGKVAVVGNCVGRGLRLHHNKRESLLLDFVGVGCKFDLVGPEDALGEALAGPVERVGAVEKTKSEAPETSASDAAAICTMARASGALTSRSALVALPAAVLKVSFTTRVIELVRGRARAVGQWFRNMGSK